MNIFENPINIKIDSKIVPLEKMELTEEEKNRLKKNQHNRIFSMQTAQSNPSYMVAPKNFDLKSISKKSSISAHKHNEKSIQNCLICFDKEPDSVIMECGHGGFF